MTFWDRVTKTPGCWIWTGALTKNGYGSVWIDGKTRYAHRVAYEETFGPIPGGLVIDHLCRTTACVRPDHLEAVTNRENTVRGERSFAFTGRCRSGRHVIRGDEDTVRVGNGDAGRTCRACRNESKRGREAHLDRMGGSR